MKRIVIIGGGYAGISLAKRLNPVLDVTLVNRKEVFFHKVAALRAVVDSAWTAAPLIAYTNFLQRGKFIQDEVMDIDVQRREIVCVSGRRLPYDIAVIATGSDYPDPANFSGTSLADAVRANRERQLQIKAARQIVIVGGGPAGVELAGEIRDLYPDKPISLIHGGDILLPDDHNPELGRRAQEVLLHKNVRVVLGEKLPAKPIDHGTLTLSTGEHMTADLIFWTTGFHANSDWLRQRHADWLEPDGQIKVEPDLRVQGEKTVYAIGDVTNTHEVKETESAKAQAKQAAKNIRSQLAGKPTKTYKLIRSNLMIVPVGKHDGVSLLPLRRQGVVMGAWITRTISGKRLFVGKWRTFLGQ